jgi:hypothetical protein
VTATRVGGRYPHCGGQRLFYLDGRDGRVRCAACGREPYTVREDAALGGSRLTDQQVGRLWFVRWEHQGGRR